MLEPWDWLETPMLVLGFCWLALLIVELTRGLTPLLEVPGTAIWVIFTLDFSLRLALGASPTDLALGPQPSSLEGPAPPSTE